MKTLISPMLLIFLFIGLKGTAQNTDKYQSGVLKGLEMLNTSKTGNDFTNTANYFDRIAQAESREWLPPYYSAYCNLLAGINNVDKTLQDQYYDKALLLIDQSNTLSANNAEVYALKGYIQFMKMTVDPQSRLSYMASSAASLAKAKALNPDNPRIDLINGQNTYFTPEAFGGGKAKARPILESAVAKFAIFKPATAIDPVWGAERAKALFAQSN